MKYRWLIFAGSLLAMGADWPEFRGPTAQGHHDSPLPIRWNPQQGIVWRTPIDGLGWSSPAIVGGRVYLTTAVEGEDGSHSLRALCLDAASGKVQWDREVFREPPGAPQPHAKNSRASPSPVVRDGKIYVHFGHQGTACLDLNGNIVWQNRELRYAPVHGNGGSPLVAEGLVVFSCDGASDPFVVALDAATGRVRWKTPRSWDSDKKFAFCTPLLIEVDGKKQIISPGAGGVAAYEPKDGSELWRVRFKGYSVVPRPVYGHGMIFISTGYDMAQFLAIRADGRGDVTDTHLVWILKRGAPYNPSPLLSGEHLFLVSDQGLASCIEAKTGRVLWNERVPGAYSASPLLADGLLYLTNEQGLTSVLKAGATFEVVAKNAMNERTLASLAASEGTIYLRTEKALYKIK